MDQDFLAPSNVVQCCNQTTIAFVLPPVLPEIRDFLMNGGCFLPVKAGMKQSSLYMFNQSGLRVLDVLQILFTTCNQPGSLTLAKPHALLHTITKIVPATARGEARALWFIGRCQQCFTDT